MKIQSKIIALTFSIVTSFSIVANENQPNLSLGKKLHDTSCQVCHTTEVFVKEDRKMKSRDALAQRVKACTQPAKVDWNNSELNAVIDYLDNSFYKF